MQYVAYVADLHPALWMRLRICMTPAGAASSKWNPFGIRRVTARARATQRKCDKRRDEESKALCLRMLRHQNWVPISHRSLVFVFFFVCRFSLISLTGILSTTHPPHNHSPRSYIVVHITNISHFVCRRAYWCPHRPTRDIHWTRRNIALDYMLCAVRAQCEICGWNIN